MAYNIPNSFAVELDFYSNVEALDLNDNHIGLHSNGDASENSVVNSLRTLNPGVDLTVQGQAQRVVVLYDGVGAQRFRVNVYVAGVETTVIDGMVDISTLFTPATGGRAWFGFTSSNGAKPNFAQKFITNLAFYEYNVNPPACYVTGIVASVNANQPNVAVLHLKDIDGNDVLVNGDFKGAAVTCSLPCGGCIVNNNLDGTYHIQYFASSASCGLLVHVNGISVSNSPFAISTIPSSSSSPSPSSSRSSTPSTSSTSTPTPSTSSTTTSTPTPSASSTSTSTSTPTPSTSCTTTSTSTSTPSTSSTTTSTPTPSTSSTTTSTSTPTPSTSCTTTSTSTSTPSTSSTT